MSTHHELDDDTNDGLPAVAGERMDRSLAAYTRACRVLLAEEQERPNPNNALVAVLCDGVRLTREHNRLYGLPGLRDMSQGDDGNDRCANCHSPASGRHGLPVNEAGEIVPVTDPTPYWAGLGACKQCHDLHAVAGAHGPAVLEAYARATAELREALYVVRRAVGTLADAADRARRMAGAP